MKVNEGKLDRTVRIVLGLVIIGLGFYYQSWWGGGGFIAFVDRTERILCLVHTPWYQYLPTQTLTLNMLNKTLTYAIKHD